MATGFLTSQTLKGTVLYVQLFLNSLPPSFPPSLPKGVVVGAPRRNSDTKIQVGGVS